MAAEIDWLDAYLPIAPCELGRSVCGIRNGGGGLPRRPRSADFVAKVENPTTSKDLNNPKGSFWRKAVIRPQRRDPKAPIALL